MEAEQKHRRALITLLAILTVLAVGTVLKQAQDVVLPLAIAWLLSFILGPALNFFAKRKVPTALAVTLMLTILLFVCYLATGFFIGRYNAFKVGYEPYQEKLVELGNIAVAKISIRLNMDIKSLSDINWGPRVLAFIQGFAGDVLGFLWKLLLMIIFLMFLLIGKPYMPYKIKKAFPGGTAENITKILNSIGKQISRYLFVQFLISLATGFIVWVALRLIGVDFAVTWGALAFFLNFIPTVGSIAASIPPILVALVQFHPKAWPVVVTVLALLCIQVTIGNVLAPKILGDELNLSPVVVLISLVFFGWMWGIVGALISVPIASTIKIVCENIEGLHPISVMMGSGKIYRKEFD